MTPKAAVPVGAKCVAETLVVESPADTVALLVAMGVEEIEEEVTGEEVEDEDPFTMEAVMLEERVGRRGEEETVPVRGAVGVTRGDGEAGTTVGVGEEEGGVLKEGLPLTLPLRRVVPEGMEDEEIESLED